MVKRQERPRKMAQTNLMISLQLLDYFSVHPLYILSAFFYAHTVLNHLIIHKVCPCRVLKQAGKYTVFSFM